MEIGTINLKTCIIYKPFKFIISSELMFNIFVFQINVVILIIFYLAKIFGPRTYEMFSFNLEISNGLY